LTTLRRFKAAPPLEAGTVVLEGEEARHLRVVLRARAGDRIVAFDGAGREADAEVVLVGRDEVECRTLGAVRAVSAPAVRIELACALPRAGAADDVVRVAVEAGATAIRPLVAARGVWRPEDPGESQRPERFERAAVAALKQSGLAWMPSFLAPASPADMAFGAADLALVGSVVPESAPIRQALEARGPFLSAVVVVGPEGGLTPEEEAELVAKGAVRVRCGPGILRVETAVIALVSHVVSFGPRAR
jgi:16S rRNA (uracil1498-N3)-methyltransferase